MSGSEPNRDNTAGEAHAFVIRVWSEEIGRGLTHWRGYIIHVPDNERRYFERLDAMVCFMEPYLRRLEARPARWRRLQAALRRVRCHLIGVRDKRAG